MIDDETKQRGVVLGLLLLTSGCHEYRMIPVAQLQPGMDVRAQLSENAIDRLRHNADVETRMLDGFTISGEVTRLVSDSLMLSVPTTVFGGDYRAMVLTQSVLLPRADVVGAEVRRLDKWKTGMVVGGIAAATAAIVLAMQRGAGNHSPVSLARRSR